MQCIGFFILRCSEARLRHPNLALLLLHLPLETLIYIQVVLVLVFHNHFSKTWDFLKFLDSSDLNHITDIQNTGIHKGF